MFTELHSSTNEKLFEKYVCNQIIRYEQNDCAVCSNDHQ